VSKVPETSKLLPIPLVRPKNIYHFSPFSTHSGIRRTPREHPDRTPILLWTPAFVGRLGQERPSLSFSDSRKSRAAKFRIPCSYHLRINDVESSLKEALRRSLDFEGVEHLSQPGYARSARRKLKASARNYACAGGRSWRRATSGRLLLTTLWKSRRKSRLTYIMKYFWGPLLNDGLHTRLPLLTCFDDTLFSIAAWASQTRLRSSSF